MEKDDILAEIKPMLDFSMTNSEIKTDQYILILLTPKKQMKFLEKIITSSN